VSTLGSLSVRLCSVGTVHLFTFKKKRQLITQNGFNFQVHLMMENQEKEIQKTKDKVKYDAGYISLKMFPLTKVAFKIVMSKHQLQVFNHRWNCAMSL
jgi:hypothetical protein